jgi:hypothetical protein
VPRRPGQQSLPHGEVMPGHADHATGGGHPAEVGRAPPSPHRRRLHPIQEGSGRHDGPRSSSGAARQVPPRVPTCIERRAHLDGGRWHVAIDNRVRA